MNNDRLESLLRESRPTLNADPTHRAALEEQLRQRPTPAPALSALLLAPAAAILLAIATHSLREPEQNAAFPLTGPDWQTPVTASEVMPWTIVRERDFDPSAAAVRDVYTQGSMGLLE